VTVARVREGGGVSGAGRGPRRPRALADPPALDFLGVRVTLYRSRLGAGGARYEALRTAELSG
jgi:2'-5' RNA ligase